MMKPLTALFSLSLISLSQPVEAGKGSKKCPKGMGEIHRNSDRKIDPLEKSGPTRTEPSTDSDSTTVTPGAENVEYGTEFLAD